MSKLDEMHAAMNARLAEAVLGKDAGFCAPDALPVVQSRQVIALLQVVAAEIERLGALCDRLEMLHDALCDRVSEAGHAIRAVGRAR